VAPRWGYDCIVVFRTAPQRLGSSFIVHNFTLHSPSPIPRLFSFQVSSFSLLMALAARQAMPPFGSRIRVIFRTASQQFGSGSSLLLTALPSREAVPPRWGCSLHSQSTAPDLYSIAPARLALRVHLRWLQLDLPKVSFLGLGSSTLRVAFGDYSTRAGAIRRRRGRSLVG